MALELKSVEYESRHAAKAGQVCFIVIRADERNIHILSMIGSVVYIVNPSIDNLSTTNPVM